MFYVFFSFRIVCIEESCRSRNKKMFFNTFKHIRKVYDFSLSVSMFPNAVTHVIIIRLPWNKNFGNQYGMFGIENEEYRNCSSLTLILKRIPLRYCMWAKSFQVHFFLFNLRYFKLPEMDIYDWSILQGLYGMWWA